MKFILVVPCALWPLVALGGCDAEGGGNVSGDTDSYADSDTVTDSNTVTDSDADSDRAACSDACPAINGGIYVDCQKRFMYGINYAWNSFGADFGGIADWGIDGVSERPQDFANDLAEMNAHGINVIRWWMMPDFRTDGVDFDSNDAPTGLGGTMVADIETALELAAQEDVYLMLTLFSFDGFHPSSDNSGIYTPSLQPLVTNPSRRRQLIDNVVVPIAQIVETSPHAERMIAWDLINEPEWAISGYSMYGGDENFTPNAGLNTVTHQEMEEFLADIIVAIRANSSAMVNVGSASRKWVHAWQELDVDFYQLHMYSWIDEWWPHEDPVSSFSIDNKPVVMGEYYAGGMSGHSYGGMADAFYDGGYAGSLAWHWNEASDGEKDDVLDFADAHSCETAYTFADTLKKKYALPLTVAGPKTPKRKSERICKLTAAGYDCSQ